MALLSLRAGGAEQGEHSLLPLFPRADLGQGGGGVAADFFLRIVQQGDEPTAHRPLLLLGAEASEDHPDRADHGHALHALAGCRGIEAGHLIAPEAFLRQIA